MTSGWYFFPRQKVKRDWTLQEPTSHHISHAKRKFPKSSTQKGAGWEGICDRSQVFVSPPHLGTVEEVVGFWWFWIWHLILLATDTLGKFNRTGQGWQLCYGGSSGYNWSPWKNHSLISMDFHHLFPSILFKKKSNKQMFFFNHRCFFLFEAQESLHILPPSKFENPANVPLPFCTFLGSPNPRFCNRPFSVPPPRRIANYPLPPRWLQTSNPSVRRGWVRCRWLFVGCSLPLRPRERCSRIQHSHLRVGWKKMPKGGKKKSEKKKRCLFGWIFMKAS